MQLLYLVNVYGWSILMCKSSMWAMQVTAGSTCCLACCCLFWICLLFCSQLLSYCFSNLSAMFQVFWVSSLILCNPTHRLYSNTSLSCLQSAAFSMLFCWNRRPITSSLCYRRRFVRVGSSPEPVGCPVDLVVHNSKTTPVNGKNGSHTRITNVLI